MALSCQAILGKDTEMPIFISPEAGHTLPLVILGIQLAIITLQSAI